MFIKSLKDYIYIFGVYLKNNVDKNNIFYIMYKNTENSYIISLTVNLLYSIFWGIWFKNEIVFNVLFHCLYIMIQILYLFTFLCLILKKTLWQNL